MATLLITSIINYKRKVMMGERENWASLICTKDDNDNEMIYMR